MATWTKAQTASRALEAARILAAGEAASAEDQARAEEIVQSVYEMLRDRGYAPFSVEAIPEWAQLQLRDIVAYKMSGPWDITGESLAGLQMKSREAERELVEQIAGYVHQLPAVALYF